MAVQRYKLADTVVVMRDSSIGIFTRCLMVFVHIFGNFENLK